MHARVSSTRTCDDGSAIGTGSQLYSGALTNEAEAGMRQALHEYRDETTAKVREFSALARGEQWWHGWYRRRRGFDPATLGLGGQERIEPLEADEGLTWAAAAARKSI